MGGTSHPLSVGTNNHIITANSKTIGATYDDIAARDADTAFNTSSGNIGKTVKILTDPVTYYVLLTIAPTWRQSTWPTYQNITERNSDTAFNTTLTNVNKIVRVESPLGYFILTSNAPTWSEFSNTDNVIKVGTPVDNQVAVWTGDGTLEGDPGLIFDVTNLGVGIPVPTERLHTGSTVAGTPNIIRAEHTLSVNADTTEGLHLFKNLNGSLFGWKIEGKGLVDADAALRFIGSAGGGGDTIHATLTRALGNFGLGITPTEKLHVNGNAIITGNLTVSGTTTTIDTTTLLVKDKNIELGVVTTPTDVTADGGGITLKGATDKTIIWIDSTNSWTLNQKLDLGTNQIVNVIDPSSAQDVATKNYVDTNTVGIFGTPVDNQVAIWKSANTIEGEAVLTFDGEILAITEETPKFKMDGNDITIELREADAAVDARSWISELNGGVLMHSVNTDLGAATEYFKITRSGTTVTALDLTSTLLTITGNTRFTGAILDSSGDPGTSGQILSSTVTGTNWITDLSVGDVIKVGTPVDNQVGVWTGDGTLEGDARLTFDTSTNTLMLGGGAIGDPGANLKVNGFFSPTFEMEEGDVSVNNKRWQTLIDNGVMNHSLLTDAGVATPYQIVTRSLSVATSIVFNTTTLSTSGGLIVDTDTLIVDAVNDRVTIGNSATGLTDLTIFQGSNSLKGLTFSGVGILGSSTTEGVSLLAGNINVANNQLWIVNKVDQGNAAKNSFRFLVGGDLPTIIGVNNTNITNKNLCFGINVLGAGAAFGFPITAVQVDVDAKVHVSTGVAAEVGIITQGVTSQTADLFQAKNVSDTVMFAIASDGALKDSSGDKGTSGQILSSTATGTNWINNAVGNVTTSDTLTDLTFLLGNGGVDIDAAESPTTTAKVYAPSGLDHVCINPAVNGESGFKLFDSTGVTSKVEMFYNETINMTGIDASVGLGVISAAELKLTGGTDLTFISNTGSYLFKPIVNTATKFQIQNAASSVILNVDTVNPMLELTSRFRIKHATTTAKIETNTANNTLEITPAVGGDALFSIQNSSTFNKISLLYSEGSDLSALSASTKLIFTSSGVYEFQATADSTTGFQILDADGGAPVFNADTVNERVGIGIVPLEKFHVVGNAKITGLLTDQKWKEPVRAATTMNGALATAYENTDTIDNVTLVTGDRILLKNQTTGSENGIYTVNASGAPTRATDFDGNDEVVGSIVNVLEGALNSKVAYKMTNTGSVTVGTTALVFKDIEDHINFVNIRGTDDWGTLETAPDGEQRVKLVGATTYRIHADHVIPLMWMPEIPTPEQFSIVDFDFVNSSILLLCEAGDTAGAPAQIWGRRMGALLCKEGNFVDNGNSEAGLVTKLFDLVGVDANSLLAMQFTLIFGFKKAGHTVNVFHDHTDSLFQNNVGGFVVNQTADVASDNLVRAVTFRHSAGVAFDKPVYTFLGNPNTNQVVNSTIDLLPNQDFICLDSALSSATEIVGNPYPGVIKGDFFSTSSAIAITTQAADDITIDSFETGGTGKTKMVFAAIQDFTVGQTVLIADEAAYDGLRVITDVDDDQKKFTFDVTHTTSGAGTLKMVKHTVASHPFVRGGTIVITDTTNNGTSQILRETDTTFNTPTAFTAGDLVGTATSNPLGVDTVGVKTLSNGAQRDSNAIGAMMVVGNSMATTIANQNEWTNLNLNALAASSSNNSRWTLTNTTTGEQRYDDVNPIRPTLVASISCASTGGSQEFEFRLVVNGSPTSDAVVASSEIGSDTVAIPLEAGMDIVQNDLVRVQVQNIDGTSNITIKNMTVQVKI